MKASLLFLLVFVSYATACAIQDTSLHEVPQIFYKNGAPVIKWVEAGEVKELSKEQSGSFDSDVKQLGSRYGIPLEEALAAGNMISERHNEQSYRGVNRWLAVSDIHGQYDLFVSLLQAHGVIDTSNNWTFADSHLVINGDILDRGEGTTEALWLVFRLQQQAEEQGGMVHYNMGNHELMVLSGDIRYIHRKHEAIGELLNEKYDEQFSQNTFFGRWMRQRTALISINDVGFVHGGISPDLARSGLRPNDINALFADSILNQPKDVYNQSERLSFLTTTQGPVWYRGFLNDEQLTDTDLDSLVNWWGVKRIVVGHTTQREVRALFGGRAIAIDAGMKDGRTGQVLIFDQGELFRGMLDGSRQRLL